MWVNLRIFDDPLGTIYVSLVSHGVYHFDLEVEVAWEFPGQVLTL